MKGYISIARSSGNSINENNCIHITLEDDLSSIRFVDLTMGLKEFAEALTGLHGCEMSYTIQGVDRVGKTREHKTVIVFVPERLRKKYNKKDWTEEDFDSVLQCVEFDGWKAYRDDLFNHHRIKQAEKDGTYVEVGFTRYV